MSGASQKHNHHMPTWAKKPSWLCVGSMFLVKWVKGASSIYTLPLLATQMSETTQFWPRELQPIV